MVSHNKFDPKCLNDSIAMQTDWTPMNKGGSNFKTHKLETINPERFEFKATIGSKAFSLLFFFVGLIVTISFIASKLSSSNFELDETVTIPALCGLVFSCIGVLLFYLETTPIVFDKRKRYFYKGRKTPDEVFDKKSLKAFAKIEDIHALQLVSNYCHGGSGSSFYSYELNLVLKSGKRIAVISHGKRDALRNDANELSLFLEKPVWDAI